MYVVHTLSHNSRGYSTSTIKRQSFHSLMYQLIVHTPSPLHAAILAQTLSLNHSFHTGPTSMKTKKTFCLELTAQGNNKKSKTSPVPRVCDLSRRAEQIPFQAPPAIVNQFKGTQMVFAFDIETHDIIRENTRAWLCGHYGFPARVLPSTMESLRVIQIAWAMGDIHLDTPTMYVF